jgi:hypothetical protein
MFIIYGKKIHSFVMHLLELQAVANVNIMKNEILSTPTKFICDVLTALVTHDYIFN